MKATSPTNPGAMGFHEWLSHDNFFEIDPPLSREGGPPEELKGESSELIVREAITFMERARWRKQPFFVVAWFGSPHAPYVALDQDLASYKDAPKHIRARLAEITAMDRAIGQLRAYLRRVGLGGNTLLWYCGDNGVPPEGRLTSPFRGHKGELYGGGLRVPGIVEWPAVISKPRATDVPAVTSDVLPTICDLLDLAPPQRPLDGLSLKPLFFGEMKARHKPICFWSYDIRYERKANPEPYIRPELQEGTTPTATPMNGRYTRNFENYRHPRISESDYRGDAAILDGHHELLVLGEPIRRELYDLRSDPGETTNRASQQPELARRLEQQLRDWQRSVLESLTGAD